MIFNCEYSNPKTVICTDWPSVSFYIWLIFPYKLITHSRVAHSVLVLAFTILFLLLEARPRFSISQTQFFFVKWSSGTCFYFSAQKNVVSISVNIFYQNGMIIFKSIFLLALSREFFKIIISKKNFERSVSYMKVMRKMFQFISKNIKSASFHFPYFEICSLLHVTLPY